VVDLAESLGGRRWLCPGAGRTVPSGTVSRPQGAEQGLFVDEGVLSPSARADYCWVAEVAASSERTAKNDRPAREL